MALNLERRMRSRMQTTAYIAGESVRVELAPRGTWIDQHDRPTRRSGQLGRATVRDQRRGEAVALGQGVQPQPRNRLPPQRDRFRSGGAVPRGVATAEQPPPGGVRGTGGEAPGAERSAATSVGLALRASRARRARGRCVQHRGEAQAGGERSEPAAPPPTEVAALCAAPPRARRRRALEAAGREGRANRTGEASSLATPGESALADGPKARPGGWPAWHASAHAGNTAASLLS